MNTNKSTEEFIEKGANLEHDRWARWQQYLFDQCVHNKDGSATIPSEMVAHWGRQISTKYTELSEQEKESDRKETRNYLSLLTSLVQQSKEEGEKKATQAAKIVYDIKCSQACEKAKEEERERILKISEDFMDTTDWHSFHEEVSSLSNKPKT